MATATEVPVRIPRPEIVLTLSQQEAQDLQRVMGAIGGAPVGTVRESTDSIYNALQGIGVVGSPFARTAGVNVRW